MTNFHEEPQRKPKLRTYSFQLDSGQAPTFTEASFGEALEKLGQWSHERLIEPEPGNALFRIGVAVYE